MSDGQHNSHAVARLRLQAAPALTQDRVFVTAQAFPTSEPSSQKFFCRPLRSSASSTYGIARRACCIQRPRIAIAPEFGVVQEVGRALSVPNIPGTLLIVVNAFLALVSIAAVIGIWMAPR
jgi:hypothetical protein